MVGIHAGSDKLTQWDFIIAGGGSGFVTRMVCQPLDVLKIRFQLQVEPIAKGNVAKYQSMVHATNVIIKEEGYKALWKGHVAAQFLSMLYGVAQFWTFEVLSRKLSHLNLPHSFKPAIDFTSGAVSGCTATVVSFPFDVMRTRLIAQSERHKIYLGMVEGFKSMYKSEGVLVFYRGIWPTMLQIAPHAGIQFMCYKLFDNFYKSFFNISNSTLSGSMVAGSLAGLCAKTAIYPLDLAKKRMQIQGFDQGRELFGKVFKCKGLNDCLVQIYRTEGFGGLFKGLSPSLVKAIFTTALYFGSYEMICQLLEKSK